MLACRLLVAAFLAYFLMSAACAPLSPPVVKVEPAEPVADQSPEPYLAGIRQEVTVWEDKLPAQGSERFNHLVRLSRAYFILGELSKTGQTAYFEKGEYYSELILKDYPDFADGHYWLALNQAGQAEHAGAGKALRLLPGIIAEMERAAGIDTIYDQGGPHRVLGRIYCEAPAWPLSVGDINKSLHHLSLAVRIAPQNSTNQLFLAETLLKLGKTGEAKKALTAVLSATEHNIWLKCIEDDRRTARRHLAEMARTAEMEAYGQTQR